VRWRGRDEVESAGRDDGQSGGFTVAVDAGLTSVNPPSVPAQAAAATLPQYSQHLQLTNAAGAIRAGLLGQGVTIGVLDTGVNRSNPALAGRVLANYVNVGASGNDLSVDDAVGHGTVVAEMAAGAAVGNWGGGVAQKASIVSARFINAADRRRLRRGQ
jgi:subtilisin family serine protease